MEKIMKSTKLVQKILRILFWIVVVVSVVSACIMIASLIFMDDTAVIQGVSITIGNYRLKLSQGYSRAQLINILWMSLANIVLYGGLSCYAIRILQGICEPMTQGKPFNTAVSDGLKKLSYTVLIFGVVRLILQLATNMVYDQMIDISSLFAANMVESCSLTVVGDGDFIIWFFLIRLFRRIFMYGETLQQLSDETL